MIKPLPLGSTGFFHDYCNDVLCLPIFLPAVLLMHRGMNLRRHDGPPTTLEILLHLVVWSIYFEGVAPRLTSLYRTTADPRDVAAYALGALVAGLIWGTWRCGSNTSPSARATPGRWNPWLLKNLFAVSERPRRIARQMLRAERLKCAAPP